MNSKNNNANGNSGLDNANGNREKITVETLGLISWYATGWLSANERARVHKLLEQHPELENYLKDEQHIIHQVREDKSILDLSALESTETRLSHVLKSLDNISQENIKQSSKLSGAQINPTIFSTIKDKISSFTQALVRGEASTLKYASFASMSVLVALLAAFIAPMIEHSFNKQADTSFHPATVQTPETKKQANATELLIGLNNNTKNDWLEKLLQQNNASLTKIPGKDGLYRIQFDKKLETHEIKSLLDQLNSHKESIWFSGEAY